METAAVPGSVIQSTANDLFFPKRSPGVSTLIVLLIAVNTEKSSFPIELPVSSLAAEASATFELVVFMFVPVTTAPP